MLKLVVGEMSSPYGYSKVRNTSLRFFVAENRVPHSMGIRKYSMIEHLRVQYLGNRYTHQLCYIFKKIVALKLSVGTVKRL